MARHHEMLKRMQTVGQLRTEKGCQDEKERVFESWYLVALFVAFAGIVRVWGDFKSDGDADAYGDVNPYRDLNTDDDGNTNVYANSYGYTYVYPLTDATANYARWSKHSITAGERDHSRKCTNINQSCILGARMGVRVRMVKRW